MPKLVEKRMKILPVVWIQSGTSQERFSDEHCEIKIPDVIMSSLFRGLIFDI